jgi:hypothetical protein
MVINKSIAISETGLIFNPVTGETFVVNQMGMEIINMLRKNSTIKDIQKQLSKQYSIDSEEIDKDLNSFINFMKRYHIIEENQQN